MKNSWFLLIDRRQSCGRGCQRVETQECRNRPSEGKRTDALSLSKKFHLPTPQSNGTNGCLVAVSSKYFFNFQLLYRIYHLVLTCLTCPVTSWSVASIIFSPQTVFFSSSLIWCNMFFSHCPDFICQTIITVCLLGFTHSSCSVQSPAYQKCGCDFLPHKPWQMLKVILYRTQVWSCWLSQGLSTDRSLGSVLAA